MGKALSLRAIDRYKSIAEFRAALGWVVQRRSAPVATESTTTAAPLTEVQINAVQAMPIDPPRAKPASKAASMAQLRGHGQRYQAASGNSSKLWVALVIALVVFAGFVFALR